MPSPLKIFFDGGCRPNPGAMEIAVVAGGKAHIRRDLGHGTRADAEWLALIEAVKIAQSLGVRDPVLLGDAADIIGQANGTLKARGGNARHLETFRALAATPPRIRHIKRTQNLAGIVLARLHDR
ncbi:MAG: ribonuclease HI [Sphingomonas sp.]